MEIKFLRKGNHIQYCEDQDFNQYELLIITKLLKGDLDRKVSGSSNIIEYYDDDQILAVEDNGEITFNRIEVYERQEICDKVYYDVYGPDFLLIRNIPLLKFFFDKEITFDPDYEGIKINFTSKYRNFILFSLGVEPERYGYDHYHFSNDGAFEFMMVRDYGYFLVQVRENDPQFHPQNYIDDKILETRDLVKFTKAQSLWQSLRFYLQFNKEVAECHSQVLELYQSVLVLEDQLEAYKESMVFIQAPDIDNARFNFLNFLRKSVQVVKLKKYLYKCVNHFELHVHTMQFSHLKFIDDLKKEVLL